MIELVKLKSNDKKLIDTLITLELPLLKEYFYPILNKQEFSSISVFINKETIAREIKEKKRDYYIVCYEKNYIGFLEMQLKENFFNILRFFLEKKHRNKGLGRKILNLLIEESKKCGYNKIEASIVNSKSSSNSVFTSWGFVFQKEIARYLGGNVYLYEFVYRLNL